MTPKEMITVEKEVYEAVLRNSVRVNDLEAENQQLKDVISKMCMELVDSDDNMSNGLAEYFSQDLLLEISEVLK